MKSLPTTIASALRPESLEIVEFEGAHRMPNRDAVGFYFAVRLQPRGETSRIVVIFSGTVMGVKPEAFGLPALPSRDEAFVMFAETAIGDALDASGLPERSADGGSATPIDCFSPHFQAWRDRPRGTDEDIEKYLFANVLASWKYGHEAWRLGPSDLLRLNCTLQDAMRIVKLHAGEAWTIADSWNEGATLVPVAAFLRAKRPAPLSFLPAEVPAVATTSSLPTDSFVDESRIAELRALTPTDLDTRKLVALCEELNLCYRAQCYHAVAALTRAVIDHVPPLFGKRTFSEVANNYAGAKSFQDVAKKLEDGARKVGDMHLHLVIRSREVLPTRVQVNFASELDVLLAEIVRLHRS